MSSSSPEYKLNDSDEDLYDTDKIEEIKNKISMFQQQNESLKKEQERIEIKRNFLMQKEAARSFDEDVDIETFNDPPKLLSFPNISMNQKEYEQFIVEDADLDEEEEGDEEDDLREAYLEAAKEKIKKLETQVLQYRKIVHDDGPDERYIQDLEAELVLYQAPKRRIQSLENQLENARHQCINLTSQFRANETTQMQKQQAYDSMKAKFLSFVTGTNKEKEELKAKLEAKVKENQTLIAIIAHLQSAAQVPALPASSQNTDTMSSTNTQTTTTTDEESMDLSSAPPTPSNVIATVPKDGKKSNETSPDLCF